MVLEKCLRWLPIFDYFAKLILFAIQSVNKFLHILFEGLIGSCLLGIGIFGVVSQNLIVELIKIQGLWISFV